MNRHEAEIIDLYDKKWEQGFLRFEIPKELPADPVKDEIQKKIAECGHIVFVHPVWWASVPAVLKNFLDTNFSARFAFKYTPERKPLGLLKGKTAQIFMTGGNIGFWAFVEKWAMRIWWDKAMLGFCGLKIKDFALFHAMQERSDKDKEGLLKLVRERAGRI